MNAPYYEVACHKHGKPLNDHDRSKGYTRIKVGTPRNKRERMSGCPECRRELVKV